MEIASEATSAIKTTKQSGLIQLVKIIVRKIRVVKAAVGDVRRPKNDT